MIITIKRIIRCVFKKKNKSELSKWSKQYCADNPKISATSVKLDMIKCYVYNKLSPYEYYKYQFFGKNEEEKKSFVSKAEQHEYFTVSKANTFPKNKYQRYQIFKQLFLREVLKLKLKGKLEEAQAYEDFLKANAKFVIKPIKGTEGRGVELAEASRFPTLEALQEDIKEECMLEALIHQGQELAIIHPSSINTVRVVSKLDKKGDFAIVYALLRTGRCGSFVDNVGAGGIVALIDKATGTVVSDGLLQTEYFAKHPDTGISYKGFAIPKWQELQQLVEKGHRIRPGQYLIGWDFAWTEAGNYDLVEANPNPSFGSYQKLAGKGIRPYFKDVLPG